MKVAILGCGPTGLFVAHAMVQLGHDITIYSRKRRSEMFGAQYLHRPIPGLTQSEPVTVKYQLQGSTEGYRNKVYSGHRVDSVSPESLAREHNAWDIREAYYKAWDLYSREIVDASGADAINPRWIRNELAWNNHHVIISTIPLYNLCRDRDNHRFESASILAVGDAPERGVWVPEWFECPESSVLCNGEPGVSWYRQSRIYGYGTIEWPISAKGLLSYGQRAADIPGAPPIRAAAVSKPISTTCDCYANSIVRVGRYGKWQKGYLSHQAYYETMEALS